MQLNNDSLTDLFIIGGGINGVGIANDAAGRGLSVTLCEQGDLACATSSKSSKLIHGGLRYLEYYEFRLVREALKEREVLLNKAPHIIHPLRFVMPHKKQLKPAWIIRIGLFLYDHLGKRQKLPASHGINLRQHPAGQPLQETLKQGFIYSDCWVDDARLVVLNAVQARELGATILTRTRFIGAQRQSDHWQITLEDVNTQEKHALKAKVLVNAAGPWAEEVLSKELHLPAKNHISLVKGSHIIVPKLYAGDFAFILINPDNRIIFVIPYLDNFSLIGTTDIAYAGDPFAAEISPEEINYLCQAVGNYFAKPVSPSDIIWSYSGVRPLHAENTDNPSAISRDYTLELDHPAGQAPILTIFGGKITTYRKLAEHVLHDLQSFFPQAKPAWTDRAPLPGGNMINSDFSAFQNHFLQKYHWLPKEIASRYARSYGTLAEKFLHNAQGMEDLGRHFGAGLYEAEVNYLCTHEWAKTSEDILWRRTKLGLYLSNEEMEKLDEWLKA